MKKIFLLSLIIILLVSISKPRYNLSGDMIRFRVIPNSNSFKDVMIKEKVVNELSDLLFIDSSSINETRKKVVTNISNINDKINVIFNENNYKYNFNIKYGMNYFPKKVYNGTKFDEGYYESLVIEIGEAKGNNYWCILYPPLCMIESESNNDKIQYKSKIVEIISKIF